MIFSYSFLAFEIVIGLPQYNVSWVAYCICGLLLYIALLNMHQIELLPKLDKRSIPHVIVIVTNILIIMYISKALTFTIKQGMPNSPEVLGASLACAAFLLNMIVILISFIFLWILSIASKIGKRLSR
jgi:hypothetical protein